jgi:hypothetical protein
MTAPVASGWSRWPVGFSPTGRRRLATAHTRSGHLSGAFYVDLSSGKSDSTNSMQRSQEPSSVFCSTARRWTRRILPEIVFGRRLVPQSAAVPQTTSVALSATTAKISPPHRILPVARLGCFRKKADAAADTPDCLYMAHRTRRLAGRRVRSSGYSCALANREERCFLTRNRPPLRAGFP